MSGEVAFGAAISEDRQHSSVVAAGRGASGLVVVDLVWYAHPAGVVKRLGELYMEHGPVVVVVNAKSQSATLVKPLAEAGIVVTGMSVEGVVVAHAEFLDLVNDGGLEHLGQPPLTAAVRAAQQRSLGGAKAWEPRVEVDQSPLVAATGGVWGFVRWEEMSTPGVYEI